MERWKLMVCYSDKTWSLVSSEIDPAQIDSEGDVVKSYLENSNDSRVNDIVFIGIYNISNIEDTNE